MTISQEEPTDPEPVKIKRKRYLPGIDDEHWNSFNAVRKKHNLSWSQVFDRFQIYQNGIEYIFSAPGELTKQLRLDLNTVMGLVSLWISNIRGNWYEIDKNPDVSKLLENNVNVYKSVPAVCIGAGPSLKEKQHLKMLYENCGNRVIFSTLHSLLWCLEEGIVPHFTAVVDGSPVMEKFIDHPLVDEHADEIKIVFCASASPDVVKRWKGSQKYFFLSGIPQNLIPNVDTYISMMLPSLSQLDTGGNSGAFNYSLASYLGCNPVAMIGMDLGYPKDLPYEKTMYYHAYAQSIGVGKGKDGYKDAQDMIAKCYHDVTHPVFGTISYTDFVYDVFLESLKGQIKYNKENLRTQAINCTEGGCLFSEDMDCMKFKDFLEKW